MKIENELKREKQQMMEEQKKLKDELLSYQAVENQLNTEGFGPTTRQTAPMNTPGRPVESSRFPQSTPRTSN